MYLAIPPRFICVSYLDEIQVEALTSNSKAKEENTPTSLQSTPEKTTQQSGDTKIEPNDDDSADVSEVVVLLGLRCFFATGIVFNRFHAHCRLYKNVFSPGLYLSK